MTLDQVREALEEIRAEAKKDDDEGAHICEDRLHVDVLRAIAEGTAEDPVAMARLALESALVDFHRWCA